MKYKYISDNIITCENFLPPLELQKIKIELMNNRVSFGPAVWSSKSNNIGETVEFFSSLCGGVDYWIGHGKTKDNNESIMNLTYWFYHQGLFQFIDSNSKVDVFQFLKKPKIHDIHVVSYNNEGYYNWHTDTANFTFNLILNEGDEFDGGEMLFLDGNETIEIPNKNNFMVVFPTYIPHAVKPIKSKNGKDVAFSQQRFSIQYWTKIG
jgi:hypothetical protein